MDAEPDRQPYVGTGLDGIWRSAQIDREEADTLPMGSDRWWALNDSAARWERQAERLGASSRTAGSKRTGAELMETLPDYPHWAPPAGRGPRDAPPADLCPAHRTAWLGWRNHITKYSTSNPTEWPGGSHIMDSRTSHTTRRRTWIEKNAGQMQLVETICRSGNSPQCNREE